MNWYEGPTLLYLLEHLHITNDRDFSDIRVPVQYVIRPQSDEYHDYRGYAGRVAGGVVKPGDKVTVEMSPYDLTKGRITWRDK